MFFKQY